MNIYIVEYGPSISDEACKVISDNLEPEISNEETSLYEISMCIEILEDFPTLSKDLEYLNSLSDNDMHPISYIEF